MRATDTCKGCGEPWPCSDSGRTDIGGRERAKHMRMTQAEADAAFRRLWLDTSENDAVLIVPGNPCADYGHILNADGTCADCGATAPTATPSPRILFSAVCVDCGESFDNCHCGEVQHG
jgi:hypothetical protein